VKNSHALQPVTVAPVAVQPSALDVLRHREDGPRFVFQPVEPHGKASRSALKQVVQTFFQGSLANAVAAFVDAKDVKLSDDEVARIESIIQQAKSRRP
jgi:predicted transcriptional regulator